MTRFFSTKNAFTTTLLWLLVVSMLGLLYLAYREGETHFIAALVIGLTIVFILWVLLDTRYVLRQNFLFYRSGPIRGRIPVGTIKSIKKHKGLFVPVTLKPALDIKGFIITYNQFDDIFVSPQHADSFLQELKKINPTIEIL
ncbi:PH domain-containing protein [Flavobacterium sp.]|uniref:PH domain-containing protein n=1 Tax=Flavobacterium sp. TaxID=239 RepID=UPI00260A18BD|nr:PH domain-containing protein [Flavobacterium sp.]